MGLEPTTFCLEGRHSTTELLPHAATHQLYLLWRYAVNANAGAGFAAGPLPPLARSPVQCDFRPSYSAVWTSCEGVTGPGSSNTASGRVGLSVLAKMRSGWPGTDTRLRSDANLMGISGWARRSNRMAASPIALPVATSSSTIPARQSIAEGTGASVLPGTAGVMGVSGLPVKNAQARPSEVKARFGSGRDPPPMPAGRRRTPRRRGSSIYS